MKLIDKYCFLAVALITIASVSSTYAATPRSEGSKPKRGGTIVIGTPFEPRQLNLAITTSWADLLVACKVFNGLLRFPENGYPEPQPDLAEKWSISPDGKRITFNLVHNARWHDGVPFTSADVKFTYEKITRELSPIRSVFQSITNIATPDPYTVVIERRRPFSLLYFNGSGGAILPKHLYENTDIATNPHNLRPVGTGPFKFKEWVKGTHIELVRSGDYFKPGKPYLDRVIFKFIGDVPSGIAALEKGEIDYLPRWIPVGEVERLKKRGGIDVSPVGGIGFSQMRWITFNMKDPNLKDVRVRRAIAHAIDTALVNRIATGGQFELGENYLWKQYPQFDPKASVPKNYKYDVEQARRLLDEAGLKVGSDGKRFRLELLTHTGVIDLDKTVEVIRDQLSKVGIEVIVKRVERALSFDLAKDGKFQLYIHSNFNSGPEPVTGPERFFTTANIGHLLGNAGSYSHPEVDRLAVEASQEPNLEKQKTIVARLQQLFMVDLPALPLQQWAPLSGYRAEFVNVVSESVDGAESLDETWWTKGGF